MPTTAGPRITITIDGHSETLSKWTLAFAFIVPILALLIIVCIGFMVWRRRTFAYDYSYQQVNHELDEEEIEFKNMLESHGSSSSHGGAGNGHGNNGDSTIDENDEELNFSTSDMGRLNMLEKYRDKLVAGANAELDKDSDEGRF
jgi:hypothetical protein